MGWLGFVARVDENEKKHCLQGYCSSPELNRLVYAISSLFVAPEELPEGWHESECPSQKNRKRGVPDPPDCCQCCFLLPR